MSSSTGRLAQPHSMEASAVASHRKYHIDTMQHKSKMLGSDWEFCFLITAAINAMYNFAAKNQTRPQTSQFPTALGANVAQ